MSASPSPKRVCPSPRPSSPQGGARGQVGPRTDFRQGGGKHNFAPPDDRGATAGPPGAFAQILEDFFSTGASRIWKRGVPNEGKRRFRVLVPKLMLFSGSRNLS